MKKYMKTIFVDFVEPITNISITDNDVDFTTFRADKSNPDYVRFLTDAQLTDKQVAALETDTWFDFPLEEVVLPVEAPVVEAPVEEAPVEELAAVE